MCLNIYHVFILLWFAPWSGAFLNMHSAFYAPEIGRNLKYLSYLPLETNERLWGNGTGKRWCDY